jgi:glycosyltransferase involved in cell wall biosynthesis
VSTLLRQFSVDIVIPALNEASTIGLVLAEIPFDRIDAMGCCARAVVVDNGSTDGTSDIARAAGAVVIFEPERGKGNAMRRAFRETRADYVVMLDGDATYPATHIPEMLDALRDGHDVVLGSRLRGTRAAGSISPVNVIGNRLLTLLACVLYGKKTSDLCTGYWAFRGEVLPMLRLTARGFNLEAELFSEVVRHKLRIGEVPVDYRRRPTPTKLRALRDGVRIARMLLRKRFHPHG